MDKVITYYKQGKFEKCVSILEKLLENDSSLEENLVRRNCLNVCQSLLTIAIDDAEKLEEFQDIFYLFYQNITSLGNLGEITSIEIELVANFNFLWWILHYSNYDSLDEAEIEQCLQIINNGLERVLGKEHLPRAHVNILMEIIENIKLLINLIHTKYSKVANLILEMIIVIILYILKCSNDEDIIKFYVELINHELLKIQSMQFKNESLNNFFKFSISKVNSDAGDQESVIDYLLIIQAACLLRLNKNKECRDLIRKYSKVNEESIWRYLGAFNAFIMEDYDQSLGFLLSVTTPIKDRLKCRYYILQGRLYSRNKDHMEAVKFFGQAKEVCDDVLATYYYLGEEYMKIGLNDMAIESFEGLIKQFEGKVKNHSSKFADIILDLIHPDDEISEVEALYILACSYGLDERFQQSANTYEKLLELKFDIPNTPNRILQVPDAITILHEASVMNLLIGDLIRSQQLCQEAFETYIPKDRKPKKTEIHIKDVKWLQNLINEELGLRETLNEPEIGDLIIFYEENLHFFNEDITGLLIQSEIQRIQENDDYKTSLAKIYSIISAHLAKTQKKGDLSEEEKHSLVLVKALAAKVCLTVAKYQMKTKTETEVDRTFKRGLSSNPGDKDVLYHYSKYFLSKGKASDASKLWKTFFKKESIMIVDQCQSLALRYLLNTIVTKRDLEKLESEIEVATLEDFSVSASQF